MKFVAGFRPRGISVQSFKMAYEIFFRMISDAEN